MFFSARTLLYGQAIGHGILAYVLGTDPRAVTDLNAVFIFGEAMHLTQTPSFDALTPPVASIAALFLLWSISDFFALFTRSSFADRTESLSTWLVFAKVRLGFFFALATASCFARPEHFEPGSAVGALVGHLSNQVVFSWTFAEFVFWGWCFITVREEKKSHEALLEKRQL